MAQDKLTPMNDVYWKRARSALSAADPVMAGLVARYGHIAFCPSGSVIESIFRAVIGQQISNRAVRTSENGGLGKLCGGNPIGNVLCFGLESEKDRSD